MRLVSAAPLRHVGGYYRLNGPPPLGLLPKKKTGKINLYIYWYAIRYLPKLYVIMARVR